MRKARCFGCAVVLFAFSTAVLYLATRQMTSLVVVVNDLPVVGPLLSSAGGAEDATTSSAAATPSSSLDHEHQLDGDNGYRSAHGNATTLTLLRVEHIFGDARIDQGAPPPSLALPPLWERALMSTAEGRRVAARVRAWRTRTDGASSTPNVEHVNQQPRQEKEKEERVQLLREGWDVRVIVEEDVPAAAAVLVAVITIPQEDVTAVDLQQLFYALLLAERLLLVHEEVEQALRQTSNNNISSRSKHCHVVATGALLMRRTALVDGPPGPEGESPSAPLNNSRNSNDLFMHQRASDVLAHTISHRQQQQQRRWAPSPNGNRRDNSCFAQFNNRSDAANKHTRTTQGRPTEEHNHTHSGDWLRRVLVGDGLRPSAPQESCHIANQGGRLGAGMHSPFQANEVALTLPLFVSRDVLQYVLLFFANDVIDVIAELEEALLLEVVAVGRQALSEDEANRRAAANDSEIGQQRHSETSPTRPDRRAAPPAEDGSSSVGQRRSEPPVPPPIAFSQFGLRRPPNNPGAIVRRSPIVAACGPPLRLKRMSPNHRVFSMPPLAVKDCFVLLLSGRDVHKTTWSTWATERHHTTTLLEPLRVSQSVLRGEGGELSGTEACEQGDWMQTLARTSHHSLLAREQMPYVWMAEDVSHGRTATAELASGGLPWRDDDHDEVRFVPVATVDLHVGDAADTAPDAAEGDNGVLAAVYVPTRIDQFRMRDMIRCYYRSLDVGVRARLPLHFLLGARATMDSRFVFRGRGTAAAVSYQDPRNDASVWHRLLAENCSTDFERRGVDAAAAGGGGDLLLLDVIDLDGAPYTTESAAVRARGVRRAMETLRAPPARTAKAWHHNSEISAMLIKLLVGMVHMVRMHPTSQFFVRGADDAYVSFQRVYLDALEWHNNRMHRRPTTDRDGRAVTDAAPPNRSAHRDDGQGPERGLRWFRGHVIATLMLNMCGRKEISRTGALWTSGAVPRWRALAPAANPVYVSGGGSMMSVDVVRFLVDSTTRMPPLLYLEEDSMLGRLVAPFVLPIKDVRFHNFFNATRRVDYAFGGSVPGAFRYCSEASWIVHKYPPEALRYVANGSMALHCTEQDLANEGGGGGAGGAQGRAHQCQRVLNARFAIGSISNLSEWPRWGLGSPRFFEKHTARSKVSRLTKRRMPCSVKHISGIFAFLNRDCHNTS